jgi:methylmalonyl-CoA mutase, N-terminal domain
MQREIQEAAYRYQQEIEGKQRVVVGVNEFVMDEPPPANLFQGDPTVARALADRLGRLRQSRHAAPAAQALEAIERAASSRDNLIPLILDGVRARLTLGEISDTLRKVFGVHQPSVVF